MPPTSGIRRFPSDDRGREPAAMLAGELAGGPELGEDRDHHAPETIGELRVLGGGDPLLQGLEGRLVIAAVPGLVPRGSPPS